jgi:hypothetical protein
MPLALRYRHSTLASPQLRPTFGRLFQHRTGNRRRFSTVGNKVLKIKSCPSVEVPR